MKQGIPERGDILNVDLDPVKGREQRGQRPVLERRATWLETLPPAVVEEVLARVRTLLD